MNAWQDLLDDHHAWTKPEDTTVDGGVFYASKSGGYPSSHDAVKRETLYLGRLDQVIDRVQELFDQWEAQDVFPETLRQDVVRRARLTAHEWIAYLVQRGNFLGRVPQIALSIWVEEEKLCCLIADNSNGFKPESSAAIVEKSKGPVWERGLGWFIMQASTDNMHYRPLGNQGFEMTFSIHNEDVPEDTSS